MTYEIYMYMYVSQHTYTCFPICISLYSRSFPIHHPSLNIHFSKPWPMYLFSFIFFIHQTGYKPHPQPASVTVFSMLALSLASMDAASMALSSIAVLSCPGLVSESVGEGGDSREPFRTEGVGDPAAGNNKTNKH